MRRKIFAIADGIREGSIVAVSPQTRICQWRTGRLQSHFRETAHRRWARHSGQCNVLKLQPFRSVFDSIRGKCCSLSYSQGSCLRAVFSSLYSRSSSTEVSMAAGPCELADGP